MANNVYALSLSLPSPIIGISSESNVPSKEPNEQMEVKMPLGSKNMPKAAKEFCIPSIFILRERDDILKPIILVVPAGIDIVRAITNFARDRDVSILVHHASGTISEVNLSNSLSPSGDLSFRGNLHMLSLSGFYTKSLSPLPPKNIPFSFFNIQFLKEKSLQLFGGLVGHKLVAAEPVHVMVFITKKHQYHEVVRPITNPTLSFINA